jgi:hypothetical protein
MGIDWCWVLGERYWVLEFGFLVLGIRKISLFSKTNTLQPYIHNSNNTQTHLYSQF